MVFGVIIRPSFAGQWRASCPVRRVAGQPVYDTVLSNLSNPDSVQQHRSLARACSSDERNMLCAERVQRYWIRRQI
jgi:hypothetical protein